MGDRTASGDETPIRAASYGIPIRPASTVMLVRDGSAGVEVFTLRRVVGMAFAGGMTAFPGGGVDPTDADPTVPWIGPGPEWWAGQWRIDADAARRQVVAAVRELFEETGILLGGAGGDPVGASEREEIRLSVAAHRIGLAQALRDLGQQLRADLLRPWARWITPPGQPRRYDTYFFVAALPPGQHAAAVTTEADAGGWRRPADVLRAERAGELGLFPPTLAMMTDLSEVASVADLLATPRQVEPVMPVVLTADGEVLRVRAGGRQYVARLRGRPPADGDLGEATGGSRTSGRTEPRPDPVGSGRPGPIAAAPDTAAPDTAASDTAAARAAAPGAANPERGQA